MSESGQAVVLRGGPVHTMDRPIGDVQAALALRDGRVLAVGSVDDARAAAGHDVLEIDVDGAAIYPGFVDTHPHLLHWSTFEEAVLGLFDARSHAEIMERIAKRAAQTPKGEWIVCSPVGEPHYFQRRSFRDLAEGVLPDRHVLDRAAPEHPVWIQAWAPTTPNVTAFNSAGLAKLGISRGAGEEQRRFHVERDADGEPTGRLIGSVNNYYNNEPTWDSLLMQLPAPTPEHFYNGTRRGAQRWNALGVTTIYEAHIMDFMMIDVYRRLRAANELSIRVLASPDAEALNVPWAPPLTIAQLDQQLEHALAIGERSDEFFQVEGVTIACGGPPDMGFMVMRRPYRGPYGELTTGVRFAGPEKLERIMRFCVQRGQRLNVLVAGDREHDEFLHHLEHVAADHPELRDRGWILEHAYVIEEQHCRRYAALGMDATTSCSFTWGEGPVIRERIGEEAMSDLIPLRRMLDAGLRVGGGMDWGPTNVFEHIELAQTHRVGTDGHRNDGQAQVVSREEAIRMWTVEAGRILHWDGVGTLTPGGHADVAILDRDIATCPVEELAGTEVLATLLGGALAHDRGLVDGRIEPVLKG